MGKESDIKEY